MTPEGRYAFISHARSDHLLLHELTCCLLGSGMPTWDDTLWDHTSGEAAEILGKAIANCAIFVVLLTDRSAQRPWVRWEVDRALAVTSLLTVVVDCGVDWNEDLHVGFRELAARHIVTFEEALDEFTTASASLIPS